jgi:glycosyltransferase involved in cell wall biosynthesis
MRILFCSQAAHRGGGVETWLESLSEALERRGWEVVTALAKGKFHDPDRYQKRHRVTNPIEIDGSAGVREIRITNLLRIFERVRPDIVFPVHLHDALLAASYAKTRGSAIRIAHCLHSQQDDAMIRMRTCMPFLDLAASVSQRGALRLGIEHIPTGVPPPLQAPRIRTRIAEVAYVGRLDHVEKRVLDAIPLMQLTRELTLHIVGSGDQEAALREGLRDQPVIFHGELSRSALYETIYPRVDALLVFSAAEAGPIVAWEAMAHGVIPVVSDFLGRAEEGILRDGETAVVFRVGDMRAAAEKIASADAASISANAPELPHDYSLPGFEEAWHNALTRTLELPAKQGSASSLPSLVSPGRLAATGLGLEALAWLRRRLGTKFRHEDPGSEWPH